MNEIPQRAIAAQHRTKWKRRKSLYNILVYFILKLDKWYDCHISPFPCALIDTAKWTHAEQVEMGVFCCCWCCCALSSSSSCENERIACTLLGMHAWCNATPTHWPPERPKKNISLFSSSHCASPSTFSHNILFSFTVHHGEPKRKNRFVDLINSFHSTCQSGQQEQKKKSFLLDCNSAQIVRWGWWEMPCNHYSIVIVIITIIVMARKLDGAAKLTELDNVKILLLAAWRQRCDFISSWD